MRAVRGAHWAASCVLVLTSQRSARAAGRAAVVERHGAEARHCRLRRASHAADLTQVRAAGGTHRNVRQRRHSLGRAARLRAAQVRDRSHQGARPAASRVANRSAVRRRARRKSRAGSRQRRRARADADDGGNAHGDDYRGVQRNRQRLDRDRPPPDHRQAATRRWSISRCSSCSPTCAPTASRPTSSPAAASSSCARGRRGFTEFRRSRSSAAAAS